MHLFQIEKWGETLKIGIKNIYIYCIRGNFSKNFKSRQNNNINNNNNKLLVTFSLRMKQKGEGKHMCNVEYHC